MIEALLYLRLTSLKNRTIGRLKRLRQPKYLFSAIVGAAYVWFFFFRGFARNSTHLAHQAAMTQTGSELSGVFDSTATLLPALGGLLLFTIVVLAWVLPGSRPGLNFTEAETAFLFPAPISRRMLINFKLLGSQFAILFTSLFFTLISNRWGSLRGNALIHALGWWVILSTLNLHYTGAALTLTRLFEAGLGTVRRRAIVLGAIVIAVVATVAWVWRDLNAPTAEDVAGVDPLARYVLTLLNGGALGWILWPFRLAIAPFFAADAHTFLVALGPALLLVAAHYFWVMRMQEVSFEEASLALAEKKSAVVAQARAGTYRLGAAKAKARRGPFPLADTGWPELAFLWKNLLSTRPYFNLRTFAVMAAIILVGSRWLYHGNDFSRALKIIVPIFSAVVGIYTILLGPQLARQDLRSDLSQADILKTYPIRGWRLILGELLTPVAILTGMVWLALLAGALAFTPTGQVVKFLTPTLQFTFSVCVAVVAAPLIALQLLVLNGATLLFPAWFQTTRALGGGVEVMGQRLIFFFGNVLVIVTALLPAAAVGGLLIFATQWLVGWPAAVVFSTVMVVAVLIGEVWCGLWWLGDRFEKFDLSAETRS